MEKFNKLVIASHNKGKIAEIRDMLLPFRIEVCSAVDLNLPDVEETGTTFEENSRLKAITLAKISGRPCLADDSGLCVNALNGRPGVYSARYAPNRDFDKGMDLLLKEIAESGSADRGAYFACVMSLAMPDGECKVFEGRVEGQIVTEKSGNGGFGYDPVFMPNGYDKTFGHFSAEEKALVSHRGRAFVKLIEYLTSL